MATVKDQVKQSLVGTIIEPSLSTDAQATFERNASKDEDTGELYMTEDEFVDAIAPAHEDYVSFLANEPINPTNFETYVQQTIELISFFTQHKIKREQYGILFQIADRRKTGRITLHDWGAFENLLAKPDAEYEIAFRLFDEKGTGTIKYEDFQKLYNHNKGHSTIPFDWNGEWASLYIGGRKHRHDMTYPQFSQMLRGLQGEKIRQAFHIFDKDNDGYIDPEDFQRIILETARHKLSDHLLDNLHTLCNISTGSKISYANVRAFQNVIREMDLVDLIIRNATQKSEDGTITRTDFLNEAARITRFSLFTPMEADILFHFAGLDAPSGRLSLSDFAKVVDSSWQSAFALGLETGTAAAQHAMSTTKRFLHSLLESAHHFALGSIAGAFGAFVVYPIDLVKTRMQNQRSKRVGEMLYKNSIDCAKKVVKNEGFKGLYSGVLPQLVGVAPEKAIKLTVNDLIRGRFTDKDTSKIWWPHEILAGGSAGACQVVSRSVQTWNPAVYEYPRSLPILLKLSKSAFKCKVRWPNTQTSPAAPPCGSSETSVLSASTKAPVPACSATSLFPASTFLHTTT